jgi:hypothetical protein
MNIMSIYHDFCFNTFKFVKSTYNNGYCDPKEAVWNAIQRLLGAGEYIQLVGADPIEAESVYNFYKEKLENLLTNE